MQIDRAIGHAPRTRGLGVRLTELKEPCVGCAGCRGLCDALIEALLLPEIVLKGKPV